MISVSTTEKGFRNEVRRNRELSVSITKVDKKTLLFFLMVAPLSVMLGWSLVAQALTGDWAWEFPLAVLFSFVASMTALLSTLLKV